MAKFRRFRGKRIRRPVTEAREFYMGYTPWSYDDTIESVESTYAFLNAHGDIISHHLEAGVPWTEALSGAAFHSNVTTGWQYRVDNTETAKSFVSITPLNNARDGLALYQGSSDNMALPGAFDGLAFNHPHVKQAFKSYAKRVVSFFNPDYLAIAVEANELMANDTTLWNDFVELYAETYAAVKTEHPDLPVFFTTSVHNMESWQWEYLLPLCAYSDLAGASYHPQLQAGFNLGDPLSALTDFIARVSKPVVVTEASYPADDISIIPGFPGTPAYQNAVYTVLLDLAQSNPFEFCIFWAHRDHDAIAGDLPALAEVWQSVGVLEADGTQRASYTTLESYFTGV